MEFPSFVLIILSWELIESATYHLVPPEEPNFDTSTEVKFTVSVTCLQNKRNVQCTNTGQKKIVISERTWVMVSIFRSRYVLLVEGTMMTHILGTPPNINRRAVEKTLHYSLHLQLKWLFEGTLFWIHITWTLQIT